MNNTVIMLSKITCDTLSGFLRWQETTSCRRMIDGEWTVTDQSYIEDWTADDLADIAAVLQDTIDRGGAVFGVFEGGKTVGFAAVQPEPFGSNGQYLELSHIYVSAEMREQGIGHSLINRAQLWAKAHGARKLYISAHPSMHSQKYFFAVGCTDAEEISAVHAEKRPLDCQMELDVYAAFDTYCGLHCEGCEFVGSHGCGGCIATDGHPFHGSCAVAECARAKHVRFCGECGEFPCDTLKGYAFDPVHGDNGARLENCTAIKLALVKAGRRGVDPVSVCGHHCDHCFLGKWCGGCRSSYNCCSFATLYEGRCENVVCAHRRKLDGCWECEELDGCTKGYYGKSEEYAAKATAMYIRRHGKEVYSAALRRAIESGMKYAGDLDAAGSVEAALALLEKYS